MLIGQSPSRADSRARTAEKCDSSGTEFRLLGWYEIERYEVHKAKAAVRLLEIGQHINPLADLSIIDNQSISEHPIVLCILALGF